VKHTNLTKYPAGTTARRLKIAKVPGKTQQQHWTAIWEKWVSGKYDSTWAQNISETGGWGGAVKINANPRVQEGQKKQA